MANQRVSFTAPALFFSRLEAFLSIHVLDCSAFTQLPFPVTSLISSNYLKLDLSFVHTLSRVHQLSTSDKLPSPSRDVLVPT